MPVLLNYVTDVVYPDFIKNYKEISSDIRSRISEIKYDPSTYDDTRFLLTMNDGNYVYINNPNFKSLEHYDKICATVKGKKGILYLDSGYGEASHFKLFEQS